MKATCKQVPVPKHGEQPESLIYLPLKVKQKMFGVITIQSFKKNAYTDYHL
jgi:transcriptional regulator with GAF, ATPase, and Fis domain